MAELLIEIDERYKDAHGNPRVLAVCRVATKESGILAIKAKY